MINIEHKYYHKLYKKQIIIRIEGQMMGAVKGHQKPVCFERESMSSDWLNSQALVSYLQYCRQVFVAEEYVIV
jgi:hypothetical protein